MNPIKPVNRGFDKLIVIAIFVGTIFAVIACRLGEMPKRETVSSTFALCNSCATLQVELNQYTFTQDEPIMVTATVVVSDNVQLWASSEGSPLKDFEVKVTNKQGELVSLTEEGFIEATTGSRLGVFHSYPFSRSFQLDPWFELSQPGTYTLTISYKARDDFSNAVKISGEPVVFIRLP